MSGFNGYFEGIRDDGRATGWIHRSDGNPAKARIRVTIDGGEPSILPADQFRADLLAADFTDPDCAFGYRIPACFADGAEHRIDIAFADTGDALPNSPQLFTLLPPAAALAEDRNLVPNAGFARWPHGVSVEPEQRLQEGPEGWLLDFWRGQPPSVTLSVDRPGNLGLAAGEFALRVTAPTLLKGYVRLVVPLAVATLAAGRYHFNLGLRRPAVAAGGNLSISEAFLAVVEDATVTRLVGIRKNIQPSQVLRLEGIAVDIGDDLIARCASGQVPALVLEFAGQGALQLFGPALSLLPRRSQPATMAPGSFEDPNIVGQLACLTLSPLWAAAGVTAPAVPAAARAGGAPRPFTQIVVPVFNAGVDVEELLASICAHTSAPYELLLADDGSGAFTGDRIAAAAARDPRLRHLRHPTNRGYTRNINAALQACVASHVVLLNSDTIVTAGWLDRLFEAMAAAPDIAATGPLSNAASWQSVPLARSAGGWSVNPLVAGLTVDGMATAVAALSDAAFPEFPLLNGFCTLFRRDALEAIGWFDDDTFPQGYGEENDLCLRLGQAGWRLRVADHAYVHHKKSRSFGAVRRSQLVGNAAQALRAKHPTIDIAVLEQRMGGCEPINRLRARLLAQLCVEQAA